MKDIEGRINIKTLVLETAKLASDKFDPKRDISISDWENMRKTLRNLRVDAVRTFSNYPLCNMLMHMHTLFPERVDLKEIENDHDAMDLLTNNFNNDEALVAPGRVVEGAVPLRVLMPKNPHNMKLDLVQVFGAKIVDLIGDPLERFKHPESRRVSNSITNDLETLADTRIIFPIQIEKLIARENVRGDIKEFFYNYSASTYQEILNLSNIKILIGDEEKLDIDQKCWPKYIDYLKSQTSWQDFAFIAYRLKILAAEKVLVSENGMELIMEKPNLDNEEIPHLPEMRRF